MYWFPDVDDVTDVMSELASVLYSDYPSPMPEFRFLGGNRGRALLESALAQPAQTYAGAYLYRTIPDKAAALLISIIKNHPLVDGNKRIALTTTIIFISFNGWVFYADHRDAVTECLRIASAKGNVDHKQVASWIRKRSIKLERARRMIRELRQWLPIIQSATEQTQRFTETLQDMRSRP